MNKILLTLLALVLTASANGRILTAINNGTWGTSSTWSPAAVPNDDDTVIIPANRVVTISSNENLNHEYLLLRVMGGLNFVGNGSKLKVGDSSVIFVYPEGIINASHNSQSITIGNSTVMTGSNSGNSVTGPVMASSATGAFQPFSFSTLPVQFLAFSTTRRGADVLVQWATALEVGAFGFEVEFSRDGRTWTTLGLVRAAGNSSSDRRYSYTARNLPAGTLQFRIRQIDLDGTFTYTAIRTVRAGADASGIKLSALSGRLLLEFGEEVRGATVRIFNIGGQLLQEQRLGSAVGQVLVPTSVKGHVVVAVSNNNELATTRQLVL
ncbi:hypothetical protein [Flaviaesturariibacter amylovorans]|uniref:T9SS type A sorting domain-containing protein n=1 Tax=Flaviaesturariibacter amylovorans TaxID=1084520 RepID=A0ABP8G6G5_9BACT